MEEVRSLREMIDYQDGAVVSKTIVKKTTGTVTLFAFDEGQALSEHTAPHDALPGGSACMSGPVPGGQPHAVAAPGRFKMVLTLIRE